MAIVYIGLGSNIGDRTRHVVNACTTLSQHPAITLQAVSSLYRTAPVGMTQQDWFLNAVARLQTTLTPPSLLSVTQATERRIGRTPTFHWGPRVIDIDILLYDALCIQTPFLTLPHAALEARLFALVPLHELAPQLKLPSGVDIQALLTTLGQHDSVRRLGPFPALHASPQITAPGELS
jgi:2-amino-4-hydroxy-6-hydroxymethyldihydropteridine diphosphokinase